MRLFVAIPLVAEIRRMLLKTLRALAEFDRDVRWVREEQMHLTLKFLGEVADGDIPRVTGALTRAVAGCAAFELRIEGSGCFPARGKARVLWVGVADDGGLSLCQREIEEHLADAGFPREDRPFSPHLTLGRVTEDRSGGALRTRVAGLRIAAIRQMVDAVVLMQSELHPAGARYTRLGSFQLGS